MPITTKITRIPTPIYFFSKPPSVNFPTPIYWVSNTHMFFWQNPYLSTKPNFDLLKSKFGLIKSKFGLIKSKYDLNKSLFDLNKPNNDFDVIYGFLETNTHMLASRNMGVGKSTVGYLDVDTLPCDSETPILKKYHIVIRHKKRGHDCSYPLIYM